LSLGGFTVYQNPVWKLDPEQSSSWAIRIQKFGRFDNRYVLRLSELKFPQCEDCHHPEKAAFRKNISFETSGSRPCRITPSVTKVFAFLFNAAENRFLENPRGESQGLAYYDVFDFCVFALWHLGKRSAYPSE
jgi:hypothetical protein